MGLFRTIALRRQRTIVSSKRAKLCRLRAPVKRSMTAPIPMYVTLLVIAGLTVAVLASLVLSVVWSLRRTIATPLPIRLLAAADPHARGVRLRIDPTHAVRGLTIESIRVPRALVEAWELQPPAGFTTGVVDVPDREHFESDLAALDGVAARRSPRRTLVEQTSLLNQIARADEEQYAEAATAARAFTDQWVLYEGALRVAGSVDVLVPAGHAVDGRGGEVGVVFAYSTGLHRVRGGAQAVITPAGR